MRRAQEAAVAIKQSNTIHSLCPLSGCRLKVTLPTSARPLARLQGWLAPVTVVLRHYKPSHFRCACYSFVDVCAAVCSAAMHVIPRGSRTRGNDWQARGTACMSCLFFWQTFSGCTSGLLQTHSRQDSNGRSLRSLKTRLTPEDFVVGWCIYIYIYI